MASEQLDQLEEIEGDVFRKSFLLALVLAISAAFVATIQGFLMALLLAALAAGLCQPIFQRLKRWMGGREGAASAVTILFVLLVIIGPAIFFFSIVTTQAVQVSQSVQPWVNDFVDVPTERNELLKRLPLPESIERMIEPYQKQILTKIGEWAGRVGSFVVSMLAAAAKGTFHFFLSLFIMLYAMFFFLKDGRAVMDRILYYIPLGNDEEDQLVERFVSVTRATLKGTLVIGIVQGGLAGGALAVAGIQGAAFWATLMAVLSIIPGVGTALVWVPAVIYLYVTGHTGAAIGVAAWCGIVVGAADNFLRPLLVGKDAKMPDLLILLSTLGGLALFGAVGIVIGPIVAALFVTVWEIYGVAFASVLPNRGAIVDSAAADAE
jgi:predicted PurR-regulated permease PerM